MLHEHGAVKAQGRSRAFLSPNQIAEPARIISLPHPPFCSLRMMSYAETGSRQFAGEPPIYLFFLGVESGFC